MRKFRINSVVVVNNELPKGDIFEKMERLDVNVIKTDSGDQANTGMHADYFPP
ncbi:MAG: hypothetical protein LBD73_01245 [Deferribacteraceae bacterium]|jgi:hypothetical protein|nr:hypothetical protein [Deferribacteraceae bacterium]